MKYHHLAMQAQRTFAQAEQRARAGHNHSPPSKMVSADATDEKQIESAYKLLCRLDAGAKAQERIRGTKCSPASVLTVLKIGDEIKLYSAEMWVVALMQFLGDTSHTADRAYIEAVRDRREGRI